MDRNIPNQSQNQNLGKQNMPQNKQEKQNFDPLKEKKGMRNMSDQDEGLDMDNEENPHQSL
ncbi:hypothetical protein Lqui_0035 [Legionella quinlivanii]|uniref:Uncharacterized protein n=1 Tax=Legionella quinlivanii TaxID=45073 RepID=A0A0W0Y814_9GAMM|nr:hypothetical protein [Legionella quinlivanii]KTD53080.1 hypothetical protein Lqui_0035 [Legionella quinlivanii]SEG16992.1 hypothetical protein SAMN02746093_02078 [Legionella quinlivanii DSM 21216]STY10461.1 Uncharacterised protein [Legionella quinlivanii]